MISSVACIAGGWSLAGFVARNRKTKVGDSLLSEIRKAVEAYGASAEQNFGFEWKTDVVKKPSKTALTGATRTTSKAPLAKNHSLASTQNREASSKGEKAKPRLKDLAQRCPKDKRPVPVPVPFKFLTQSRSRTVGRAAKGAKSNETPVRTNQTRRRADQPEMARQKGGPASRFQTGQRKPFVAMVKSSPSLRFKERTTKPVPQRDRSRKPNAQNTGVLAGSRSEPRMPKVRDGSDRRAIQPAPYSFTTRSKMTEVNLEESDEKKRAVTKGLSNKVSEKSVKDGPHHRPDGDKLVTKTSSKQLRIKKESTQKRQTTKPEPFSSRGTSDKKRAKTINASRSKKNTEKKRSGSDGTVALTASAGDAAPSSAAAAAAVARDTPVRCLLKKLRNLRPPRAPVNSPVTTPCSVGWGRAETALSSTRTPERPGTSANSPFSLYAFSFSTFHATS